MRDDMRDNDPVVEEVRNETGDEAPLKHKLWTFQQFINGFGFFAGCANQDRDPKEKHSDALEQKKKSSEMAKINDAVLQQEEEECVLKHQQNHIG